MQLDEEKQKLREEVDNNLKLIEEIRKERNKVIAYYAGVLIFDILLGGVLWLLCWIAKAPPTTSVKLVTIVFIVILLIAIGVDLVHTAATNGEE
jgi:hypothetical protein